MAKIDFPKKQEQRLIPKYLLEYAEELQENHPDPTAEWGGGSGGSPIEAGTGILITGTETKTISVDTETIPTVAELATVAFSGSYSNLSDKPDLSVYELKEDAFTGDYGDLTNKPDLSVYELKTDAFSGDYNDLTNKPDLSIYAETADLGDCAYLDEDELSIAYSQITGTPSIPTNTSDLNNDSGYITSSALSGYATETWVSNQGYLTSVTWSDVSNKPTFATVATTGDYDDLINKPTIPVVPTNVSAFTNDAGYITGIDSSDVIDALGYTPGTSNFSGSYNDLTNKPTIPTATSQLTNDSGFITSASLYGYVPFETVSGMKLIEAGNYYGAGYEPGLTNYNMLTSTRNTFKLPVDKSGTIALTSDIPSIPAGIDTLEITINNGSTYQLTATELAKVQTGCRILLHFNNSGIDMGEYLYPVGNSDLYQAYLYKGYTRLDSMSQTNLGPIIGVIGISISLTGLASYLYSELEFAKVARTGSYNDLTDKPTIPDVSNYYTKTEVDEITDLIAADIPTTASSTSTSTVTPTTITLTFTYSDNTTENVTLMTGASVATTTTTTLS